MARMLQMPIQKSTKFMGFMSTTIKEFSNNNLDKKYKDLDL